MLFWIIVGVIAFIGIPYGVMVYNNDVKDGKPPKEAIWHAVLRGASWPLEQLGKRGLAAWKAMFGKSD